MDRASPLAGTQDALASLGVARSPLIGAPEGCTAVYRTAPSEGALPGAGAPTPSATRLMPSAIPPEEIASLLDRTAIVIPSSGQRTSIELKPKMPPPCRT